MAIETNDLRAAAVPRWLQRWRRALARVLGPALKVTLVSGCLVSLAGCTRSYYRKDVDKEVSEVLGSKDKFAAWKIQNWHVYPDPKARFAEVGDPDHPFEPPDEPADRAMAPNPQKPYKAGIARMEGTGYLELIARWDKENRERKIKEREEEYLETHEPPGTEEGGVPKPPARPGDVGAALPGPEMVNKPGSPPVPVDPYAPIDAIAEAKARTRLDITGRPTFLLTLDQAAELAMFNSREFQDQREDLYLACLPVTQERFAFSTQLFAAQDAVRAASGSGTAGGATNSWTLNNGTGFSKILPTGGLLLLNFSNQTVFNFLNPKTLTSVTTLDFSALQPLLQGGGQAVTLESLTQAERTLLYQIRWYARFRKQLYVEVASNNGGAISGGVFQPSGVLTNNPAGETQGNVNDIGSSGLTPGAIPFAPATTIAAAIVPPSSPGVLALNPAITPSPSGYLNTMLQKMQVYIDQENLDVLCDILLRFRGLLDGDVVGPLQVQSVEQQLLTGKATLLNDQQDYLQSLDSFKLALGIPMRIDIDMDDTQLRPLIKQYRKARSVIENEQAAVAVASALIDVESAPRLRAELKRLYTRSPIVRQTRFAQNILARWGEWEKLTTMALTARLDAMRKEANQLQDRRAELQREGKTLSPAEQARLAELADQRDLGALELALRQYEAAYVQMGKPKKPAPGGERQRIRQFQSVVSTWQQVLVIARDEQWAKVRSSWPDLPPCCIQGVDLVNDDINKALPAAAQYALEHRLDLMNVRGQVVDAWRQLRVYANALLGVFNVGYNLTATSPLNAAQPTNIGGSMTTNQLTINTQLPLVRIQQRNNYRACQIAFTRQRRALQEAEDITVQVVRNEIFLLRQYLESYKVQKRQLELAYVTIDSSMESLQQPTAPGGGRGSDGPAALTQQLLNAQRTLPTAQNGLLTVWVNYLDARLQLYRDLELMPLDERGVWIDQIKECECGVKKAEETGPLLPEPRKLPDVPAPAKVTR